jgi:ankyrin repeat protein
MNILFIALAMMASPLCAMHNASNNQVSPLIKAASEGDEEALRIQLPKKIERFEVWQNVLSALNKAAEKNHVGCVKILIDEQGGSNKAGIAKDLIPRITDRGTPIMLDTLLAYIPKEEHKACIALKGRMLEPPLHRALRSGNKALADRLVELGATFDKDEEADSGKILGAVICGGITSYLIKLLRDQKLDPNSEVHYSFPLLHCAGFYGQAACVRLLLEYKANPNIAGDRDSNTVLHYAANARDDVRDKEGSAKCNEGKLAILSMPVFKSLINQVNGHQETPLYKAVDSKFHRAIKQLLEAGADVRIPNDYKYTPFMSAVRWGDVVSAEMLLEAGSPTEGVEKALVSFFGFITMPEEEKSENMVRFALKHRFDINLQDEKGRTPLYRALEEGYQAVATLLLDNGATIGKEAAHGATPLHIAAYENIEHKKAAILRDILGKYPHDINKQDGTGSTPLHNAAHVGNDAGIELLAQAGASYEMQDEKGNTPVHVALISSENRAILDWRFYAGRRALIKNGGSSTLCIANNEGRTPIHCAAAEGNKHILQSLIEGLMLDLELKDAQGKTPLALAVKVKDAECQAILCKAGASASNIDPHPLHYAARYNSALCIQKLLENDAMLLEGESIVNKVDKQGHTALWIAADECNLKAVRILLAAGADPKSAKDTRWRSHDDYFKIQEELEKASKK